MCVAFARTIKAVTQSQIHRSEWEKKKRIERTTDDGSTESIYKKQYLYEERDTNISHSHHITEVEWDRKTLLVVYTQLQSNSKHKFSFVYM